MTNEELIELFSMAVIFDHEAEVYLKDDTKQVQDVCVGDELLGLNGKYNKVTAVHRPVNVRYPFLRYGIGVSEFKKVGFNTYLEVGEHTPIYSRRCGPLYDLVPSLKRACDLSLHENWVELCNPSLKNNEYFHGELMKISLKRCDRKIPYLIGIDGGALVVNNFILGECNSKKIKNLMMKEGTHARRIQKEVGEDNPETVELREDHQGPGAWEFEA